ncbi:MAG: hypothetical protein HDT44_00470 [Ruminococcaceae bacterium]|nr:hypothetical protein [Oscillospiraceae bacterium]
MSLPTQRAKPFLTPFELVIFAVLGALMYCSKIIMEWAPNIHLLGMFTMTYTLVFRAKGLIPIYVYVFLNGLFSGFAVWWIPYLYLWAILWGVTMLLPKKMPDKIAAFVYPVVCGLHGIAFGTLYAPAQALLFGFSFKQTLAWIASGFPFDVIHGVSNVCAGLLILPLTKLIRKLDKGAYRGK